MSFLPFLYTLLFRKSIKLKQPVISRKMHWFVIVFCLLGSKSQIRIASAEKTILFCGLVTDMFFKPIRINVMHLKTIWSFFLLESILQIEKRTERTIDGVLLLVLSFYVLSETPSIERKENLQRPLRFRFALFFRHTILFLSKLRQNLCIFIEFSFL